MRPQRFSSSRWFVLSGPSGVVLCCPVQRFVLSGPSGVILCYLVLSTACQQSPSPRDLSACLPACLPIREWERAGHEKQGKAEPEKPSKNSYRKADNQTWGIIYAGISSFFSEAGPVTLEVALWLGYEYDYVYDSQFIGEFLQSEPCGPKGHNGCFLLFP